jgi:CheY-like chemotaxis protein
MEAILDKRPLILLVIDIPEIIEVMATVFDVDGYDHRVAETYAEAVHLLRQHDREIALVITELVFHSTRMGDEVDPDGSLRDSTEEERWYPGLRLYRRYLEQHTDRRPCIFVTSMLDAAPPSLSLRPGTYWFSIPFDSRSFRSKVRLALDHTRETIYARNVISPALRLELGEVNDELIRYLATHPEYMYELRPRLYEEVVAWLLADMGYDVDLTRMSKDGGIDIIATKTDWASDVLLVVECKRYRRSNRVGLGIVQRLEGAASGMGADRAMLATTSSFTKEACEWGQRSVGIRLSLKDFNDFRDLLSGYRE